MTVEDIPRPIRWDESYLAGHSISFVRISNNPHDKLYPWGLENVDAGSCFLPHFFTLSFSAASSSRIGWHITCNSISIG